MINNSDIARQGMDSIESLRACLPVVPMPVASAVPCVPAQTTASMGGTVNIGCPPSLAFGPSQYWVKDQASPCITSWGAAQQPSSLSVTSWGESQQTPSIPSRKVSKALYFQRFKFNIHLLQPPSSSSQYLTSWGESQQTLSSPAVSSSTSQYLTSWGESQQTSSSPDVSISSSHYLTSWGESQQTSSVPSCGVSTILLFQRFKVIFMCYSLHHLPLSILPAGGNLSKPYPLLLYHHLRLHISPAGGNLSKPHLLLMYPPLHLNI